MIKPYLQLIRLPAGFSAASNVLAAMVIATAARPEPALLFLTLIASLCLYYGGMALNDCLDLAEDRRLRADRPLVRGTLQPKQAWLVAVALMIGGLALSAMVSVNALFFALLLAALIVLYNSKRLPQVLHIWAMAACRYAHWLFIFACGGFESVSFWLWPLPLLFYVAGLTRISEAESGSADFLRYRNTAVGLMSMAFLSLTLLMLSYGSLVSGLPALACFMAWLWRLLLSGEQAQVRSGAEVQSLVRQLVMGVVIVDACVLAVAGYPVVGALVLLLLLPGRYVGRWISVS